MFERLYIDCKSIGYLAACSIYDPSGASYVHIYKEFRSRFGLDEDTYDLFFDSYKEAIAFVRKTIYGRD